ncbi:histidine kinase [Jonesia quinghaiensis]|uniref:histidine kinase n=1 Tax=Jonesia quinghaiensis TaxID=262806 RepID=UPI00146AFA80|nr:histidine kinase [Jonesia quinghaiensis]
MDKETSRWRTLWALPIFPPPRLSVWGRVWRWLVVVLGGIAMFFLVYGTIFQAPEFADFPGMTVDIVQRMVILDLLSTPLAFVAMSLRRRFPLAAICLAGLFSSVTSLGSVAILLTTISVATRRQWKEILGGVAAWTVSASFAYLLWPPYFMGGIASTSFSIVTMFAICVAIGFYVGGRREALASLQARVEAAEETRDARAAQARANERSVIAREMHDVLAHRISLVALHSGALAFRTDLSATEVRETAEIIRENSHRALTELRQVLGVLRDPQALVDSSPDAPQPRLSDIDQVVRDARLAGTRVDVSMDDETREALPQLQEAVSRNAYRVLQESLTNVRKHAPNALAHLSVHRTDGGLEIDVWNSMRTVQETDMPASGFGLIGMSERVKSFGGRISYGPTPDNRYVVQVWFPWVEEEQ